MTSGNEWRNSFNTQYNNLLNGAAPGLDDYEISLYLTKAQRQLVDNYYSGYYSVGESYEETERVRSILKPLVLPIVVSPTSGNQSFDERPSSIESGVLKSYIVTHNQADLWYIVEESAVIDVDGTDNFVLVKPERHDYYWKIRNNPFRSPKENLVWRLDVSDRTNSLEIISRYPVKEYRCRYLRFPPPIIISDLNFGDLAGLGMSIDGQTSYSNSVLHSSQHEKIVERAVEMAVKDYKENNLNNQVSLNMRSL